MSEQIYEVNSSDLQTMLLIIADSEEHALDIAYNHSDSDDWEAAFLSDIETGIIFCD